MNLCRVVIRPVCYFYFLAFVCFFNASGQNLVPRLEASDCPVPVPSGENVKCYYLVVSESRQLKNDTTIRLPIIILKSDNPNPKPDPILRTFGGPGASSLGLIGSRPVSPWLKERDLIIFEQRGTHYAQPALECPEVNDTNISSVKNQLGAEGARRNEISAAKICYDRLVKQGFNLSAYNSVESAADIEDLRRALRLDKINLWGLSYSSRLMLNVMRDYPNGIRSVVLESSLPPEVNYDETGVDGIVRTLKQVFNNCKLDAECAEAFPNLENEFYETVAKLNTEPISAAVKDGKTGEIVQIKLDGNDFVTWIADYLLSDAFVISDIPTIVHQTFKGSYDLFKRYANAKIVANDGLGMRYSVWCGEEIPFEDRQKIKSQSSIYPNLKGYEVMALPDICRIWKVSAAKTIENKGVKSSIPTLVLTAEYDAYTPPAWGQLMAGNLKNSFLFEVPWSGHGPAFSTPCAGEMIAKFFADPKVAPNSECLYEIKKSNHFNVKNPKL